MNARTARGNLAEIDFRISDDRRRRSLPAIDAIDVEYMLNERFSFRAPLVRRGTRGVITLSRSDVIAARVGFLLRVHFVRI